ncbi:MAG: class I SAM-dependent methyltransferase [Oligoflexia bacterium]|nr:class I SAM-dependent methyltransferase [Oligoflexia bacterium]
MASLSISETADIDTSSEDYARRFAGPAGEWLLQVQSAAVLQLAGAGEDRAVLDVGGGHAQLAPPLIEAGFRVMVAGSSQSCAERLRAALAGGRCDFIACSLLRLPFDDRSYDTVVSVRYLSHCPVWQDCIKELCRVAARRVIVDYPRRGGFNSFYKMLFGFKKKLEGNTRDYLTFSDSEIEGAFEAAGFQAERQIGQFVLPMVFHRILKRPAVSAMLERMLGGLGLAARFGTPVIASWVRKTE